MAIPNIGGNYLSEVAALRANARQAELDRKARADIANQQVMASVFGQPLMTLGTSLVGAAAERAMDAPYKLAAAGGYELSADDQARQQAAQDLAFKAGRPDASYGAASESRAPARGLDLGANGIKDKTILKFSAAPSPVDVSGAFDAPTVQPAVAPKVQPAPKVQRPMPAPISRRPAEDASARRGADPMDGGVVVPPLPRVPGLYAEGAEPRTSPAGFRAVVDAAGRAALPAKARALMDISNQVRESNAADVAFKNAQTEAALANTSLTPERRDKFIADTNASIERAVKDRVLAGVALANIEETSLKAALDAARTFQQRFTALGGKANDPQYQIELTKVVRKYGNQEVPHWGVELGAPPVKPSKGNGRGNGSSGLGNPGSVDEGTPYVTGRVRTTDRKGQPVWKAEDVPLTDKVVGQLVKNPARWGLEASDVGEIRKLAQALRATAPGDVGNRTAIKIKIAQTVQAAQVARGSRVANASEPYTESDSDKARREAAEKRRVDAAKAAADTKKSDAENRFNSSGASLSGALAGIKSGDKASQTRFLEGLTRGARADRFRVEVNGELVTVPGGAVRAMLQGKGAGSTAEEKAALGVLRQQYVQQRAGENAELETRRAQAWAASLPALRKAYREMGGTGDLGDELRTRFKLTPPAGVTPGPSAPRAPGAAQGDQSSADPVDQLFAQINAMDKPASWKRRVYLAEVKKRGWA